MVMWTDCPVMTIAVDWNVKQQKKNMYIIIEKILPCDPLNCSMGSPILIISICMGNPSEYKWLIKLQLDVENCMHMLILWEMWLNYN